MYLSILPQQGEIADKILLILGILRAKSLLRRISLVIVCFNAKRNMFGYKLAYKRHSVSVMGELGWECHLFRFMRELKSEYGVKKLIRVGKPGSLNEEVHVREL